jgi:hypothetical protein
MSPAGRIYVDLDDVLSDTIGPLTRLVAQHFGRRVAVDDVVRFDLGDSFGLDPDELESFLRLAHRPEVLEALEPSPGAAPALAAWIERGYAVDVLTGRPPSSAAASRRWLAAHAIPHTSFACVDKYARGDAGAGDEPALALDALAQRGFALAVEDCLEVAALLVERWDVPVALVDRPWNRDLSGLSRSAVAGIVRCSSWAEIAERFTRP